MASYYQFGGKKTMTSNSGPYEAVIADLKRQRDKIDRTIKSLVELSGGASATEATQPARVDEMGPVGMGPAEGAFLGMSIPDATKKLLQTRKKALGNIEIVKELEAGGLVLTSGNKTNTVGSVLNRRSKKAGDIVSVGRGKWGLKEWYPNRRFDRKGSGDGPSGEESDDLKPDVVTNDSSDSSEHEQP